MQKSYSHCVPKDNENANDKKSRRICVVLRTGDQKYFDKDTGEACVDLAPRPPMKYTYGHIAGLQEGKMYTRRELKRMNAFQVSISSSRLCHEEIISHSIVGFVGISIKSCLREGSVDRMILVQMPSSYLERELDRIRSRISGTLRNGGSEGIPSSLVS